jgi:hypothetical protein
MNSEKTGPERTKTTTATAAQRAPGYPYLVGNLAAVGDPENGIGPRVLLSCTMEQIQAVETVRMMEPHAVIPVEELERLRKIESYRAEDKIAFDLLRDQRRELERKLEAIQELHNMQLAGISTACFGNTVEGAALRIGRDNPYWTVAYGDACAAVDREIRERTRAEAADALVFELRMGLGQIAELPTNQLASPEQCSAVAIAMDYLAKTPADMGRELQDLRDELATRVAPDGKPTFSLDFRGGYGETMPLAKLAEILKGNYIDDGAWNWVANNRCKHLVVFIDTRDDRRCRVYDRDYVALTLAQLEFQHGAGRAPEPVKTNTPGDDATMTGGSE